MGKVVRNVAATSLRMQQVQVALAVEQWCTCHA